MFVLKSTHEKLMSLQREHYEAALVTLHERIDDLRKLVFVEKPTWEQEHPIRVANAVLDGQEVMPDEDERREQEMREANRILSGAYDNVEESW